METSCMFQDLFTAGERTPVPIQHEAVLAPETVWVLHS